MSNANTIRRQIAGTQQLTLASISGTAVGTTQTVFQLNNNGLTLSGGGFIPLSAGVTGLYSGTGQVLHIRANGTVVGQTAATTSLVLELVEIPASALPIPSTDSSATVIGLGQPIATTAAKQLAGTSASFQLDAFIQLDANGTLSGYWQSQIDDAVITSPVAIASVTGLAGEQDLNFLLAATLSGAETGVIVTLNEFAIDAQ